MKNTGCGPGFTGKIFYTKKYFNTFITITVVHVFIACDKNLKPQLSLKSETSTELKI